MTAYPVVAVTPNTRTETLYRWEGGLHLRDRTVPTVTWMVVDQPADLEVPCPDCAGTGSIRDVWGEMTCSHCRNRSGRVVRVYAAETQWEAMDGWTTTNLDSCGCKRRQVVRWQATTADLLPVVDGRGGENIISPCGGGSYLDHPGNWVCPGPHTTVVDLALAAGLRPGQTVLRLDGWEPVNPPITEMTCPHCNGRRGDLDRLDEAFWLDGRVEPGSVPECPVCSEQPDTDGYPTGVVPLSVPSGTIIRINF